MDGGASNESDARLALRLDRHWGRGRVNSRGGINAQGSPRCFPRVSTLWQRRHEEQNREDHPRSNLSVVDGAVPCGSSGKEVVMLETLVVILVALWLLGLVTSYTMGGLVHLLLVVAVVVILVRVIQGRRVL